MSETVASDLAERIVNAIVGDISGRSGIGDEFNEIDDDVRDSLMETWATIVQKELDKVTP